MNTLTAFAKSIILKCMAPTGYDFVKVKDKPDAEHIDVLPLIIEDYMRRTPKEKYFLVQLGANDGEHNALIKDGITIHRPEQVNTLLQRSSQWDGLLVEPLPVAFEKLTRHYAGKKGLAFEQAAVTGFDGTVELYFPSFDQVHETSFASLAKGNVVMGVRDSKREVMSTTVAAISLKSLFQKHHVGFIDLMFIDTEGCDCKIVTELLQQTPSRPGIIQFEHFNVERSEYNKCCQLLAQNNYQLLQVGIDTVCLHQPTAK